VDQESVHPRASTVVRSGEGRVADLGDALGVAFKLWGEDGGASLAVVEHRAPAAHRA
jgi:hypothetical protein